MITLWLRDRVAGQRLSRATSEYLRQLHQAPVLETQRATRNLLSDLRREPGPKVYLGETAWGAPVLVPLLELVKACSLTVGGMGSGKTMFALLLIHAMIKRLPALRTMSFGVLDAKGELFARTLFLLGQRLAELNEEDRAELLERIVIIDLSARDAVSPYNILARWPYVDEDFFVTSRLETLRELLPASDKLSLRGASVLKPSLKLLAEFALPLTYLKAVLADEVLRYRLVSRSRNAEVRQYFERCFAQESKQTIAALDARMESLFSSESLRLALSGSSAPDFRRLQNDGRIILVNCGGTAIARGVRLLLQGLLLSDIRQAIFARPNMPEVTYLWCADEAQNFFLTRQQQEDLADICTMGRSYGSFFTFLCQNLTTAVPDARLLETLHTNVRWTMTMRGGPRDAQFLRPALPVTGRLERPDPNPFSERTLYSAEEERSLVMDSIAHLPDRVGYLWLKTRSATAIKIRTQRLNLPDGEEFRQAVEDLRNEPRLGARLARQEHEHRMRERDREWLSVAQPATPSEEHWEDIYRRREALWRA